MLQRAPTTNYRHLRYVAGYVDPNRRFVIEWRDEASRYGRVVARMDRPMAFLTSKRRTA